MLLIKSEGRRKQSNLHRGEDKQHKQTHKQTHKQIQAHKNKDEDEHTRQSFETPYLPWHSFHILQTYQASHLACNCEASADAQGGGT